MAQGIPSHEVSVGDPFIYADASSETYYLYRSSSAHAPLGGVEMLKSRDLQTWDGPYQVMDVPKDNWITGTIWAPEVHKWRGKYYLFATVTSDLHWKADHPGWPAYTYRGTQTFVSRSPEGPFVPLDKSGPIPPMEYMTIDGTLWVEDGGPYMVYCHEWVQVVDGTMEYVPMSRDLSHATAAPKVMFCASSAPWNKGYRHGDDTRYVTDGPFLWRSHTGQLLMIWSGYGAKGYTIGIARSVTGRLSGPWQQQAKPLYADHGGHAMIFKDFSGQLRIIYHIWRDKKRYPVIRELLDEGDTFRLGDVVAQ